MCSERVVSASVRNEPVHEERLRSERELVCAMSVSAYISEDLFVRSSEVKKDVALVVGLDAHREAECHMNERDGMDYVSCPVSVGIQYPANRLSDLFGWTGLSVDWRSKPQLCF